jgi:NAD+ synthase/NAD+ synthase (glutamine-hydrolysing)
VKIALAQLDARVADIAGNLAKIRAAASRAQAAGAELVVFPEQALGGYPALDMWEEPGFVRANLRALKELARETGETALLVGFVDEHRGKAGKPAANAAALLHRGKIAAVRWKTLLPTYDVFDEARYFEPAASNAPIRFKGARLGVTICEDAWAPAAQAESGLPLYAADPVRAQAKAGADLLINISSSPFVRGKPRFRRALFAGHARRARRPMLYCNLVGGNDETIFDGNSLVFDARGRLCAHGKPFAEDLVLVDTERLSPERAPELSAVEEMGEALCLGIRDYMDKCGFSTALVGVSGGIDSAVVAALAARALGPGRVTGVAMPSVYSSQGSLDDARALARNAGFRLLEIPITPAFDAFQASLRDAFRSGPGDAGLALQNLQSRSRGTLLMALSNKEGSLLLSTGNKSELSVGYCTLYGDMNGGLAVLADVPKRAVYELARWLNRERAVIPESSITKAPSAELRPNQTDQDDLPPYDTVDAVLEDYIERRWDPEKIARRRKLPLKLVSGLLDKIDRAEYKRRQAPPSLKVSPKAFGVGRRMPIARGSYRSRA